MVALEGVQILCLIFFPVVICDSESWNIKKAKHQKTDAFEKTLEESLGQQGDQSSPS